MNRERSYLYKKAMKDARENFRSMGISLLLFMIVFGVLKNYVFFPLIGKIWGLALNTTPEGYISESNILQALIKSPWVLLIGAALIVVFAVLAMWQVSAMMIGISYMRKGLKMKFPDLFRLSVLQLRGSLKAKNWMLLVYSLVIVPLADIYQTNSLVKAFAIPEYIQDFINSKTLIFIVFVILILFVAYIALKWLFLLPSFILKKKDFKDAKTESNSLTAGCWFKNGVNLALYSIVEFLRLSIAPMILIMFPVVLCYHFTKNLEFSSSLFNNIGISMGLDVVKSITSPMVQLSIMFFLVEMYFTRLDVQGADTTVMLPELKEAEKTRLTVRGGYTVCVCALSVLLAGTYLSTVLISQENSELIMELFGKTEIIAHKGYSSKAPENTMPAFDAAAECENVSCIELDVRTTKDGVPVVIHNATITDATGVNKSVYDCTFEELQELPAPYAMSEKDFPDAKIPSLEEVLASYANCVPLLIEIKGFKQDPELPGKIVALMKQYGCEYTSLIHSGDYGALKAVKEIDPDIQCGLILCIVTGNYYDLPYADFFSIEHTFVDDDIVSALHRRGKDVFAWTVNYPESAEALEFSGIDGIITDVPDEIAEYVANTNDLVDSIVTKQITRYLGSDEGEKALQTFAEGTY